MLINADAKALEIFTAAFLSQDKLLVEELQNDVDIHTLNQEAFNLPSRLIAKTLGFRILYGGTEYSFANDPDFTHVSTSEKFWKSKIDAFYDKYKGIYNWHNKIIQEATTTGKVVGPTGRFWRFYQDERGNWPLTRIKNFPVQGTGADLMAIARVSFANRFKRLGIDGKLVSTVHDSIVVDVATNEVERTCNLFHDVFKDIPDNFKRLFGKEFNLPLKCEVLYGPVMNSLTEFKQVVQ